MLQPSKAFGRFTATNLMLVLAIPAIVKKEMNPFLGTNLVIGYHKLPSVKNYWFSVATYPLHTLLQPWLKTDFLNFLLNVNHNSQMPKDNKEKLQKLRSLTLAINALYVKLCNVSKYQSIYERKILLKGKSSYEFL